MVSWIATHYEATLRVSRACEPDPYWEALFPIVPHLAICTWPLRRPYLLGENSIGWTHSRVLIELVYVNILIQVMMFSLSQIIFLYKLYIV